jgi:thiosulfate/3-mercaptopyruvate sulfurtransferase
MLWIRRAGAAAGARSCPVAAVARGSDGRAGDVGYRNRQMAFTTLVDTATLAGLLSDPAVVIVDCRARLDDPGWGEREYLASHVPGAVFASLDRDLSGRPSGTNGRHPLPEPDALARTLGRLGIGRGSQVVAYDQDSGAFASRLWWLLRWMGHDAVAVVDGGFARWVAEGRETFAGRQTRPAADFVGTPRRSTVASAAEVAALADRRQGRLLDVRAPERYRGEAEPIDRAAGHIPGAVNYFFKWSLEETGGFRARPDLRARLDAALEGTSPSQVVCYCGSGITACHTLLALEHAGLEGGRLYAGSWSEWSSDPARPVEKG